MRSWPEKEFRSSHLHPLARVFPGPARARGYLAAYSLQHDFHHYVLPVYAAKLPRFWFPIGWAVAGHVVVACRLSRSEDRLFAKYYLLRWEEEYARLLGYDGRVYASPKRALTLISRKVRREWVQSSIQPLPTGACIIQVPPLDDLAAIILREINSSRSKEL